MSSRSRSSTPSGCPRTCATASGCPSRSSPTRWCDRRAAQGLTRCPTSEAQPLAKQSLRFLYRILFLLYAEASPELGVLPVGRTGVRAGLQPRPAPRADAGRAGHARARKPAPTSTTRWPCCSGSSTTGTRRARPSSDGPTIRHPGLTFNALRADLFRPEATALIDEVGLGNEALQQVLAAPAAVSKEQAQAADRGFISYAELGINQLGAVYEGLMSYTGFFADDGPLRGRQGRRRREGLLGGPGRRAPTASRRDGLRHDARTR